MSEAQTAAPAAAPVAAPPADGLTATDARGRVLKLRVMDPADMLDLLEAAGPASGNQGYMQYAMAVLSVAEIDGVPTPPAKDRQGIKAVARMLGNEGLVAATHKMFGTGASEPGQDLETAKN